MRIVMLASGSGSNVRAIAEAMDGGRCAVQWCGLVSDRSEAPVLGYAASRGVPTTVVRPGDFSTRVAWDTALAAAAAAFDPDWLVLAGFMRIVGAPVLERFPRRIVNVHPALLPAFPGAHGARDALAQGVRISGCTVHLVDEGVDTGPILAQAAVPVLGSDDEATLQRRIQSAEHRLLPAVLDALSRGVITVEPHVQVQDVTREGDRLFSIPVG